MSINKRFFYIRVSSKDQNIDRQLHEALMLNIDERDIFIDKLSGKDFNRPQYQVLKNVLREGDTLYIKSLDRLGRNKQMILDEWQELVKIRKIDVIVLDMPCLDTTKYKNMGGMESLIIDLILQLLSFMAEDERTRIRQRQAEGIKIAREKGKKFGRNKIQVDQEKFKQVYKKWKATEITGKAAMEILEMTRSTFYRRVRELESQKLNNMK